MRSIIVLLILAPLCLFSQQRPNIILFLVDDMGWTDTSVPFTNTSYPNNAVFRTPNMEKLAKKGVRFSAVYTQSLCTPSRVSLMTGMNAARHRVTNYTSPDLNKPTDASYAGLKWPEWNYNGLATDNNINHTAIATPLPLLLRKAGYYTIIAGKGHFAPFGNPSSNPVNIGFIESIASDATGHPASYLGMNNFGNKEQHGYSFKKGVRGLEEYHGKDIFLTEALTIEAKKAMDKALDLKAPFFLYFSNYAVHSPIMADKRFYQKYLDKGLDSIEAKYATLIEGMDKSLGDIMAYVEKKGIEKNTIILFMSDNGGLALTPPRAGKAFQQNFPLRSGKGSLYEGGVREPMMVYWPGITKGGKIAEQYIAIEDFFPSILEIAGIKNFGTVQTIDGVSFTRYLKNNNDKDDSRYIIRHFPNNWIQGNSTLKKDFPEISLEDMGMGPASSIRKGDWKLLFFYGTGKAELYNLKDDLGEQFNLINENPQIANQLITLLREKLKNDFNAQFPYNQKSKSMILPFIK